MQNNGEPSCEFVVNDKKHMANTNSFNLYILPSKYRYKEKIMKLSENELTSQLELKQKKSTVKCNIIKQVKSLLI